LTANDVRRIFEGIAFLLGKGRGEPATGRVYLRSIGRLEPSFATTGLRLDVCWTYIRPGPLAAPKGRPAAAED